MKTNLLKASPAFHKHSGREEYQTTVSPGPQMYNTKKENTACVASYYSGENPHIGTKKSGKESQ